MTIVGLLAWFCLLISGFSHLATFFVGGTFDSVLAFGPMLAAALVVWLCTLRQSAKEGPSFWKGVSFSGKLLLLAGLLYVSGVFYLAGRVHAEADNRSYALTYDGKLQGSYAEAFKEYSARLAARKWTAFWMLVYLGPVLYYSSRRPLHLSYNEHISGGADPVSQ